MVATRRATRGSSQDRGAGTPEQQKTEVISPTSPTRTRRSVRKDGRISENSTDESTSGMTSKCPLKSENMKNSTQIITRRRNISGQSEAEVSEAGSTASNTSTTRSRSRQSLGQLTDSTRKLRSQRRALITEPIIESKENSELSEGESNCSSVSTTARRKQPRNASRRVSTRTRKQLLLSEPTSDVSDVESNSSSVSEGKINATRSIRKCRARQPSYKEPTSDAESCSSGFSLRPLARRSSKRNNPKVQPSEVELINESNKDDSQETLTKQSPKINAGKSEAQSSVEDQNVLSSPRRSSRYQSAKKQKDDTVSDTNKDDAEDEKTFQKQSPKTVKSDAHSPEGEQIDLSNLRRSSRKKAAVVEEEGMIVSDTERSQSHDTLNQVLDVDQPEVDDSAKITDELCVETGVVSSVQSNETHLEENILPDLVLRLSDNSTDEESAIEESHVVNVNDVTVEETKTSPDLPESANMSESINVCLSIDGNESEKSKHSDDDQNIEDDDDDNDVEEEDEHNMEEDIEESHVVNVNDVTVEETKTSQDLLESANMSESINVCLSIDGNESETSKNSDDDQNIEDDDDDNDGEEEDEHNMEEDIEEVIDVERSKKESTQQPQDVVGDGLFVIDTAPGMDVSKKYYIEDEKEENEQGEASEPEEEQAEVAGPEEEEDDDDDFIDEEEEDDDDEEEMLLNRPKSGFVLSTSIDTGINIKEMGGLYINFDAKKPNPGPSLLSKMKKGTKNPDELLQKSVVTPDFEKKDCVLPYKESRFKLKKMRKEERDKTTGRGWFDMKAPELTDEIKNDLKALKMRSAMDSKRFYKKNDRDGFPKYFEVGTVVDNPIDFYHSRVPKKKRKTTIVEELLADSEFRRNNKKKYMEIIAEKAARAEGKKFRKKKKFQT